MALVWHSPSRYSHLGEEIRKWKVSLCVSLYNSVLRQTKQIIKKNTWFCSHIPDFPYVQHPPSTHSFSFLPSCFAVTVISGESLRSLYCGLVMKPGPGPSMVAQLANPLSHGTGISYGHWSSSRLFHFLSCSLHMAWERRGGWPKALHSCTHIRRRPRGGS